MSTLVSSSSRLPVSVSVPRRRAGEIQFCEGLCCLERQRLRLENRGDTPGALRGVPLPVFAHIGDDSVARVVRCDGRIRNAAAEDIVVVQLGVGISTAWVR